MSDNLSFELLTADDRSNAEASVSPTSVAPVPAGVAADVTGSLYISDVQTRMPP